MSNKIIAGDYNNWDVVFSLSKMYFMRGLKREHIDKSTIVFWDVLQDVQSHSFWGPVLGAGAGGLMLGPLGAIAGAALGSRGSKTAYYLVSLDFASGKKSLLQLDPQGFNEFRRCIF